MKILHNRRSPMRPGSAAFTIVELVVAVGITALLAGLMIAVVTNLTGGWNRSQGALTAGGGARLVLDQLTSDLSSAVVRRDGHVWLAVTASDDTGQGSWVNSPYAKPPSFDPGAQHAGLAEEDVGQLSAARFGRAGVWLRLIVPEPTATRKKDLPVAPVAVSYRLIRRPPAKTQSGATPHYLLFRTEVNSKDTFDGGYDFDPASPEQPAYLTAFQSPDPHDIIADHVIDFGIWLYAREVDGRLIRIYPDEASEGYAGFPDTRDRFPAVADVMVRILTPEGAQLLAAWETRGAPDDWWRIAESHSQVFTRRILLPVSPL